EDALVVAEEIALDGGAAVAQAEDEVLVPVVGVVLHQVPEHRPGAHLDQRLRDRIGVATAQAHSLATAEQDDFHVGSRGRLYPTSVRWSAPGLQRIVSSDDGLHPLPTAAGKTPAPHPRRRA